jgi:hypothetical protein
MGLVGKPEGQRPLDSGIIFFKIDRKEIRWEGVNWIHLAQVNTSGVLLFTR